jgi:hypothetical protein
LAAIAEKSPPLYGVLADSTAMTDGDQLVIVTANDMFGTLIHSDGNKSVLLNAVAAAMGKPMRIKRGRPKADTPADDAADPLSAFLRQSAQAGITIEMKG